MVAIYLIFVWVVFVSVFSFSFYQFAKDIKLESPKHFLFAFLMITHYIFFVVCRIAFLLHNQTYIAIDLLSIVLLFRNAYFQLKKIDKYRRNELQ